MKLRHSLSALIFISSGAAVADDCMPIISAPIDIISSGIYCLQTDLSVTGFTNDVAITISADDVTVDFKGHELRGPHYGGVAGRPTYRGVVSDNVYNTTIKNGRISGFGQGIILQSSPPLTSGHLIENMHLDTIAGTAIGMNTLRTTVRNNRITNVDGALVAGCVCSQQVNGITSGNIYGTASGNSIINNTITGLATPSSNNAYGINLSRSSNTLIEGNYIETAWNTTGSTGVIINHSSNATVIDNRFHNTQTAVKYFSSSGKYSRNIADSTSGGTYIGGTPVGENY